MQVGAAVQFNPPLVSVIVSTAPPTSVTPAVAPLPVFPENATVAEVYPEPPPVIVTVLITPEASTVHVAVAAVPSPEIVTEGVE